MDNSITGSVRISNLDRMYNVLEQLHKDNINRNILTKIDIRRKVLNDMVRNGVISGEEYVIKLREMYEKLI